MRRRLSCVRLQCLVNSSLRLEKSGVGNAKDSCTCANVQEAHMRQVKTKENMMEKCSLRARRLYRLKIVAQLPFKIALEIGAKLQ